MREPTHFAQLGLRPDPLSGLVFASQSLGLSYMAQGSNPCFPFSPASHESPRLSPFSPSACGAVASNPKQPKPGRADAVERWDAHKISRPRSRSPASSCGSCASPGRADSCERWDISKIKKNPATSMISGERYKRPPSRASSAERWDAHKKPRDDAVSDADCQSTGDRPIIHKEEPLGDETTEMEETAPRTHLVFSGPTFVASPEPSMLPMPAFFPRRSGMIPLPGFVQAH
ncbi:hypothetical protein BRADI_1g33843v3 [Brachypodium distachyon]|uniref:Uncharacterized protein n=1 Tax=Brachypodium distachyon TaxID=15368 RepID=A0A2K2DML2_BRADI|nr:hypothetical protein BRADI_1g33843v3 [Brachypodium distachyon]